MVILVIVGTGNMPLETEAAAAASAAAAVPELDPPGAERREETEGGDRNCSGGNSFGTAGPSWLFSIQIL